MQSGDGLVVRVRPYGGRLEAAQVAGLAELAERYGNGLIDVTSRANLQIRGVSEQGHRRLIEGLALLGLIDPDPDIEARRNIVVTPFWNSGDETAALAAELEEALADSTLDLPTKFGFAIDDGKSRVLADDSADMRIERDRDGRLLVRDRWRKARPLRRARRGREHGAGARELVHLPPAARRAGEGAWQRISRPARSCRQSLSGETEPAPVMAASRPGHYPHGALVGFAFGQMLHTTLHQFSGCGHALRMTPWRMMLSEGKREMPSGAGLITEPYDPMLRVIACSGAPRCREAHADTRALASAACAAYRPRYARFTSPAAPRAARIPARPRSRWLRPATASISIRDGSTRDEPVLRGPQRCRHRHRSLHPGRRPLMPHAYETDGAAIYRQSFATIRAEADLARFSPTRSRWWCA